MRIRTLDLIERLLRAACYLILGVALVGVLNGSSCYVTSCYDDDYYHDDDHDHDDDDDHDCDDDDDDDQDDPPPPIVAAPGTLSAPTGDQAAIRALIEVGVRVVLPTVPARQTLVPRWNALPRIGSFRSVRTKDGPLRFSALRELRGVGLTGPVGFGPTGDAVSEDELVEFAVFFLVMNAESLGLPEGLGDWEFVGVHRKGTDTRIVFQAALSEGIGGSVLSTVVFDGFAMLESVHHQLTE